MTVRTNARPMDLCTVTLTEAQWSTIRTALIHLACDCSTTGRHQAADFYNEAYKGLAEAMGL